jgi:hypothetical protein
VIGLLLSACESDDLGQPCGTTPAPVGTPVEGENPVLEVVRVERDGDCESFQCLTHRGLPPYCTRSCELSETEAEPKSCTSDDQCTGGMFASGVTGRCIDGTCACEEDDDCPTAKHCADGICRDDDCPKGYWCKEVQQIGPLAGQRFCVFKDGCTSNFFCEDLGNMECRELGCFGACKREYWDCEEQTSERCEELECYAPCIRQGGGRYFCTDMALAGNPSDVEDQNRAKDCEAADCYSACVKQLEGTCEYNRMVCEEFSNLACGCAGAGNGSSDISACLDADLVCSPDASREAWDAGTVTRASICTPTAF